MRYPEDRAESAEILQRILQLMARQRAAFHPWSYALWYEYATGQNPRLSHILDERLATATPLTDQDVYRLYAQHVSAWDRRLVAALTSASNEIRTAQEPPRKSLLHTQPLAAEPQWKEWETLAERLRKAQAEALLDPLTGLKNRRGLDRAVSELSGENASMGGTALLMLDIDRFKSINDTHGHLQGDRVIRAVAHALQDNIKGRDIAARLGGDEFLVLLPDTSLVNAATVSEQIRHTVAQMRIIDVAPDRDQARVTVSVGIAVAAAQETAAQLMERADDALYAAKKAGRNRVQLAAQPISPAPADTARISL